MQFKPEGPTPAKIMVVGEAIGDREEAEGRPFLGSAGFELTKMLQEAGIVRTSCFLTYVCRHRPPGNDINKFIPKTKKLITNEHVYIHNRAVDPRIAEGIAELQAEIDACRPTLIIALGNVAMWALTGKWGIKAWRGSALEYRAAFGDVKVIPTYSPQTVLKEWSLRGTIVRDFKRCAHEAKTCYYDKPDYNFIVAPTFDQVIETLTDLLDKVCLNNETLKLSVDIETRAGHIACTGIAWSPVDAICIPHMAVDKPDGYWTLEEEVPIIWMLYRLLTHPNVAVVGQNFLYDAQYFYRHFCFIPRLVRDTMIAQHTCFSTLPKGLDFLSSMYCAYHLYWKGEGKDWNPKIPEKQYWTYNCKDAVITYEIDTVEQRNVELMKIDGPAAFQQALFHPVLETMNRGINVDTTKRKELHAVYRGRMENRLAYLEDVLGYPLNPNSPVQIKDLFYKQLAQRPIIDRKTGSPTTNEPALIKIGEREPLLKPVCQAILDYRSDSTVISTFIDAKLDTDGRLRCSFNIAGNPEGKSAPPTYRFSSSTNAFGTGCNFQNIPPEIRDLFIPDEGYEFFDIDLSSADLRVVVWESDEREMKALLAAGLNPYVETAKEFYHDPSITKQHPKYKIFKSFAHGTHYLGTPEGMAPKLGMTVMECERLQKWYFNRFPRIKQWQERFKGQLFSRHMVENIFGYRYYITDRIDSRVLNQAIAWLPQSTIGIYINKIWMNLHTNHHDLVQVLLQVHDSLAGQFLTEERQTALDAIHASSQIILPYADPLIIPIGIKTSTTSWGKCE